MNNAFKCYEVTGGRYVTVATYLVLPLYELDTMINHVDSSFYVIFCCSSVLFV